MNNQPIPMEWVERLFQRLHGRFGNTFIDKFKLGQLDANGQDIGILNAKTTWALELSGISVERLKAGLDAKYTYAPSCDEFLKHCVTNNIQDFKALPAPAYEVNKAQADKLSKYISDKLKPKTDYKAWAKRIIANPKNFPEISLKYAQEAMKHEVA
jgi:hypothetical protein